MSGDVSIPGTSEHNGTKKYNELIKAYRIKHDQNTCCICHLLSASVIYSLWKVALICILMFCISTCALYVRTQQNALCHAHLPSVTQSLNYNLGVGEKKKKESEWIQSLSLFSSESRILKPQLSINWTLFCQFAYQEWWRLNLGWRHTYLSSHVFIIISG